MSTTEQQVIEYPASGQTYSHNEYGVYSYGTYEDWSVLAGRTKRTFLGRFATLEEAQANFPDAIWHGTGSGFQEQTIPTTPPDWFDPANAGETWSDED